MRILRSSALNIPVCLCNLIYNIKRKTSCLEHSVEGCLFDIFVTYAPMLYILRLCLRLLLEGGDNAFHSHATGAFDQHVVALP